MAKGKKQKDPFGLPKIEIPRIEIPEIKPIDMGDFFGKEPKAAPPTTKRTSCPQSVKETLWRKYFGNTLTGECYVCGKPIDYTSFEVGHNKPHIKGGKWNVNNLRPLCRSCNRSMGTMTVETFKKKHFSKKSTSEKKKPKTTPKKKKTTKK